jgi:type IV secretion system protein VirD4
MIPKDKRDVRAYILNLSSILFKPHNENTDSFFIDAAKSAFLFFAEWLVWKNGETSLSEVRDQLLESADIVNTIRIMIAEDGLPKEIVKDGNGVLLSEDSEKQWAGVVGTLKETIELFADSRVAKATSGKNEINAEIFRKENTSLYIKVRDKDAKRLEPLNTMLIESLGTQLISKMPEEEDRRVTFVLDEFVRLGKMNIIRELPSISRGYNVNSIFVAQDYEQISVKYGREAISTFDSNCAYKVVFQQNNLQTAEKISRTVGNRTDIRESKGKSLSSREMQLNNSVGQNISTSEEGIALVSPQDILSLKRSCCFILAQGFSAFPIKAKIPFYFSERVFKKLV